MKILRQKKMVIRDVVGCLPFSGKEVTSLGLIKKEQSHAYAWDGVTIADKMEEALVEMGLPRMVEYAELTGEERTFQVEVTLKVKFDTDDRKEMISVVK